MYQTLEFNEERLDTQQQFEKVYVSRIEELRRTRDATLRTDPFSELALIHREYLKENSKMTIGSSPESDIRLEGAEILPAHAGIEVTKTDQALRAVEKAVVARLGKPTVNVTVLNLLDTTGFRIGQFNLRYISHSTWGRMIEVYDTKHPSLMDFKGLDYFPVDPDYYVEAEIIPHEKPRRIGLVYSHQDELPWWVYGRLVFSLKGVQCQLELYTRSIDQNKISQDGFMLMFTDGTGGQESYLGGRFLRVEGKMSGRIIVDFNQAYNPPCCYSPVFNCPSPRRQNHLPIAVRAGQKWHPVGLRDQ